MSLTSLQPAPWAVAAATLPIAFAQVREDAEVDRWVVRAVGRPCRVVMTASGGCTAAALAVEPGVSRLELVDLNPAQIALSRLKLRFLNKAPQERLALLGHAPMAGRLKALRHELDPLGLPSSALGPAAVLAVHGPDHAGRYEALFAALRAELDAGCSLETALETTFALENLEALFPKAAAAERVEEYPVHFARRLRLGLASSSVEENPYLSSVLQGRFGNSVVPWLSAPIPTRLPEVSWRVSGMVEHLDDVKGEADVVHLSNILDWSTAEDAAAVLAAARRALRPGGWVVVRQLNSPHDVPALGRGFEWPEAASRSLHARERSFLYRRLRVGRAV